MFFEPSPVETLILYGPDDHVIWPDFPDARGQAFPDHVGPFVVPAPGTSCSGSRPSCSTARSARSAATCSRRIPPARAYLPRMEDQELARATSRVGDILAAAEQAAEEMRPDAERRMRERIAEGDRAAANRIQAAEAEALEILANAQDEAREDPRRGRRGVRRGRRATPPASRRARSSARRPARRARCCATAPSCRGNLRELSDSLRSNAELLLRDVRLAHAEMTARLDQLSPPRPSRPSPGGRGRADDDDARRPRVPPGRAGRPAR